MNRPRPLFRLRRILAGTLTIVLVGAACGAQTATPSPRPLPAASPSPPAAAPPTAAPTAGPTEAPAPSPTSPYASPPGDLAVIDHPTRTAFVQLFEWRWADVALECERWLGPHGFAGVQVSPPQEHAFIDDGTSHFPWWQRYQAVSYRIESRSGTREEFADMARRCAAAGVDIYVDTLVNHMTALESGTGSAGSTFTKYDYPGIYTPPDFHANPDAAHPDVLCERSIADFGDPEEVHTCELLGLADLRTEDEQVQDRLAIYMADLYDLGARGYRIDAAKHVADGELAAILDRLRAKLPARAEFFVVQEVIDEAEAWKPAYYDSGRVDEFTYSVGITGAFLNRNGMTLAGLQPPESFPFLAPSDVAVPFVDNHDSQRGRIGRGLFLTYKRAAPYALANVFMLAYPYGYPRLMSSYVFSDTEVGPPSDAGGNTTPVYASDDARTEPNCGLEPGQWVCEHRWQAIAGMVGFRNFTNDRGEVTHWWTNPDDGNQIAFGRGDHGFVVINRSEAPLVATLPTSMAPGTYCDVTSGDLLAAGSCSGRTVEVKTDGSIAVDLQPMRALAIHIGALAGGP